MTRQRDPSIWWTEAWSPVTGCTPAGAGCDHCWARAMVRRFGSLHAGRFGDWLPFDRVVCHPGALDKPLHWRKPRVVLVSMLGDLFHEQVPEVFIGEVALRMRMAANHTYCILTKRPQRAARHIADVWPHRFSSRSYLMASVWDQASTDAACAAFSALPAGVRWGLHVEPMLGPIVAVNVWAECRTGEHEPSPSWVVCGGENGPGARPMDPRWSLDLREQCRAAGVPFWWKGPGSWIKGTSMGDPRVMAIIADLEQTREVPW